MDFTEISIYTLFIGAALMIIVAVLMFLFIVIDFLPINQFESFRDLIGEICHAILNLGLLLFLFGLAGMAIGMAIEGISTGEYNIKLNRHDRSKTSITFEKRPTRFLFQTIMFIGTSIFTIYFGVKMFRDIYKKYNQ